MSDLGWDGHSVIYGTPDNMRKIDISPVTGKISLATVFVDSNHFCWHGLAYVIVSGIWKNVRDRLGWSLI